MEKLADAAIQITTKNGVGSTPNCVATDKAIGKLNAAAALFVINSVNILVIINRIASNAYGPKLSAIPIIWRAIMEAKPEFSMALLIAKAQAIVIKISQEMYFVYFLGGKSFVHAMMIVVIQTKKNISKRILGTPLSRLATLLPSPP